MNRLLSDGIFDHRPEAIRACKGCCGGRSPSTFTGKSDRGIPFGEFLVTKPSAAGGTGAGNESDSFGWGVAKGVGKGVAGLAVGAVVGVGITAAAPFVGATGLAIGTGALIIGAGYGGLQLGRSIYQSGSGSEVTWTGTATGRTFTPSQRGELAGESLVGAATLGFGAAKVLAPRFGSVGARGLSTYGDALRGPLGPGRTSHPEEWAQTMTKAQEMGVAVVSRPGVMAYEPAKGAPGRLLIDPDASIAALRHEFQHITDDAALGHPGLRVLADPNQFWRLEFRGYMQEINTAGSLRDFNAGRSILNEMRQRRMEVLGK